MVFLYSRLQFLLSRGPVSLRTARVFVSRKHLSKVFSPFQQVGDNALPKVTYYALAYCFCHGDYYATHRGSGLRGFLFYKDRGHQLRRGETACWVEILAALTMAHYYITPCNLLVLVNSMRPFLVVPVVFPETLSSLPSIFPVRLQ